MGGGGGGLSVTRLMQDSLDDSGCGDSLSCGSCGSCLYFMVYWLCVFFFSSFTTNLASLPCTCTCVFSCTYTCAHRYFKPSQLSGDIHVVGYMNAKCGFK